MHVLIVILVVIVQFIVAQFLGFGGALMLGAGNGAELVVFAVGYTLGVWGVGWAATRLLGARYSAPATAARLIGALAGAALGIIVIFATPAVGFIRASYPLIGALLGYYLAHLVRR